MLKKLNTYHRPKTLREAMDVTMEFEVEHQITQPELDLTVMETCYEEPKLEESYTTEEVQTTSNSETRLQSTRKSTSVPEATVFGTEELPRKSKSKQVRLWIRLQDLSTVKGTTSTMVIEPSTKDNSNLDQTRCLNISLELTLA